MSNDMLSTITPKSDQLNADDLPAGISKTITVTRVSIKSGEQPVSINYEGDNGKPYKPCKSMCRVMVHCWGADANQYVGRSMTLYCEPSVKWGGMEVGGIRISHLSDIDTKIVIALTATRGKRAPFTVSPLVVPPPTSTPKSAVLPDGQEPASVELIADLVAAYEDKQWTDEQKDGLLMKVSNLRVKKGLEPATRWNQTTRRQIRWAIAQVK